MNEVVTKRDEFGTAIFVYQQGVYNNVPRRAALSRNILLKWMTPCWLMPPGAYEEPAALVVRVTGHRRR